MSNFDLLQEVDTTLGKKIIHSNTGRNVCLQDHISFQLSVHTISLLLTVSTHAALNLLSTYIHCVLISLLKNQLKKKSLVLASERRKSRFYKERTNGGQSIRTHSQKNPD